MRLTGLRGRVGVGSVGLVVALLTSLVLLTGSVPEAEVGAALAGQGAGTSGAARPDQASSSREGRPANDPDSSDLPSGAPNQAPVPETEAITSVLLERLPPGQGGGNGAAPSGSSDGDAVLEAAVLSLVNQERAVAGCSALNDDGPLTGLARAHSADMRDRDFFSHNNPSGQTPWDRAEAAGIGYLAAENIAAGQSSAAAVTQAFMGSPDHRANILNCSLKTLGVGVAHGGSYGIYWTQDFGS